jgi:hypothetical protein
MWSNQIARLGIVPVASDHPAAGRLRDHRNTCKVLTRDPWVLDTIKGHLIDFTSKPCQDVVPHTPQYTADQDHLIKEELKELLSKGAVVEVEGSTQMDGG